MEKAPNETIMATHHHTTADLSHVGMTTRTATPNTGERRTLRSTLVVALWAAGAALATALPDEWQIAAAGGAAIGAVVSAALAWVAPRGPLAPPGGTRDLDRHLARGRRTEQPLAVLVAAFPSTARSSLGDIADGLRLADSFELVTVAGRLELWGVLDQRSLDRGRFEARLATIAGTEIRVGWADFPEDGLTLGALTRTARGRALTDHADTTAVSAPIIAGHRPAEALAAVERPAQ
jgi:hypothetical protein